MISYQYDRCKCALRNLNDLIIDRPDYINIVEIYLTVSVLWLWLTWPVGDEEIKMSSENYLFIPTKRINKTVIWCLDSMILNSALLNKKV